MAHDFRHSRPPSIVLLQWVVIVTNNNICRYLGFPSKLCHSVPCGNKHCGWSEVGREWKQFLQLIMGSLEKIGIRCLPEENVSISSNVHIIPEWSNQWNQVIQWKSLRSVFSKSELKWNNSICAHLWTKTIERSKQVTVTIITSQTFISEATKISYCIVVHNHQLLYVLSTCHHEWFLYVSESMYSWLTKSVCWVLPKNWIGVERLTGGELPSRSLSNLVSPTSTPKSKKLV